MKVEEALKELLKAAEEMDPKNHAEAALKFYIEEEVERIMQMMHIVYPPNLVVISSDNPFYHPIEGRYKPV